MNKRFLLPILAGFLTAQTAFAASQPVMTEGTVKKVDKAANRLTIAHGPIENLGMPGMTMAFPLKDARQLEGIKAGDKVRFHAEQVGGAITVTTLETMK